MREINIDESFRARVNAVASEEAKMIGSLNGSIEKGGGNYAGVFGELLFIKEFGGNRENSYDYDIMYEGLAIDVKTKRRSVSPKPYYECSIPNYNTEQDCDYYYLFQSGRITHRQPCSGTSPQKTTTKKQPSTRKEMLIPITTLNLKQTAGTCQFESWRMVTPLMKLNHKKLDSFS